MHTKLPLILTLICVVGGPASASGTGLSQPGSPVNLLPQGSFESPGVPTEWAEGFNIPNNQEFRVVSEDGKRWLRIENRDPGRQLDYVHAYVKVTPQIASLTVSVRMRATNLKVGKEGWHTARVALMFEGGSFGFPPVVPELRADSDWVAESVELKVPAGAKRLNIQPAMFHCTGVLEIADLSVTPRLAAPTLLADAVLPTGISLDWDKTNVQAVSARRAQAMLDGIWRFVPAPEAAATPPKPGWGYIKVPGDWQSRSGRRSDILARGGGTKWDLYDGSSVTLAWYQRQATIPPEWQGRAISLRFDRVCTDAMVYVNGTPCGTVAWPWGSVDITRAVTPGKTADIRLLVAAVADPDVELAGVKDPGRVEFVAEMLDEKGAVEKTFAADAAVEAKEIQTVTLSWPWADPRLWDNPYRYYRW